MKKILMADGKAYIANEISVNPELSDFTPTPRTITAAEKEVVIYCLQQRMLVCMSNLEHAVESNSICRVEMVGDEVRNYQFKMADGHAHHFSMPAYKAMEELTILLKQNRMETIQDWDAVMHPLLWDQMLKALVTYCKHELPLILFAIEGLQISLNRLYTSPLSI